MSATDVAMAVDGLAAGYGGGDIIRDISLSVPRGELLVVIGPNGSGKSTFIKALAGLVRARIGDITLDGRSITRLSAAGRVTAGLAFVPQEFNVFPNLTIGENLRVSTEFLAASAGQRPKSAITCSPCSRRCPDASTCLRATSRADSGRCSLSPAR